MLQDYLFDWNKISIIEKTLHQCEEGMSTLGIESSLNFKCDIYQANTQLIVYGGQ